MLCFFIGHRDAESGLTPQIEAAVHRHIAEYGVTEFVVGQYGAFDRMAARAVINAKRHYPNITLSILLPYHPSERSVNAPDGYDDTFYPPGMENVPRKLAIARANKYMVDNSDFLIAYVCHPASNAQNLLEYAQARERKGLIRIENLSAIDCFAQHKNI